VSRTALVVAVTLAASAVVAGCDGEHDPADVSPRPSASTDGVTTTSPPSTATTDAQLETPPDSFVLAIAPSQTSAGGRIRIKGVGFCPGAVVSIGYEPEEGRPELTKVGTATADARGEFDTSIDLPSSRDRGNYRVQALDAATASAARPAPACTDHTAAALVNVS
jgi:hypothetical protein